MVAVADIRGRRTRRVKAAVAALELPDAAWKMCPWKPRSLVETGLRQWLRCCGHSMQGRKMIGMPSRAVDELWHGLILCTAQYAEFCRRAYGDFLHHHPEGAAPAGISGAADSMHEQLHRTVLAWSAVAEPGERCVLWDLDQRLGLDEPWGIDLADVGLIQAVACRDVANQRKLAHIATAYAPSS